MNQQDQRKMNAHHNQQLLKREEAFVCHHHKIDKPPKAIRNENTKLLCACTGQKCEGVCRTTHLHRPRYARPIKSKGKDKLDSAHRRSWTNPPNQCPETYTL